MLKNWTGILTIIIFLFIGSSTASAEQPPADHEVFAFLKEAFQSQLSLGESHHTLEEIEAILNPYFTKEYQENFLAEHLFEEKEGYITYGTDFPAYYIPFFSYMDETMVVEEEEGILTVYEFFSSETDMPSLYDDHYEYVKLMQDESSWKVVEWGFEYEEPDFMVENVSINQNNNEESREEKFQEILSGIYSFGFIHNPFNHHSYYFNAPLKAAQIIHERHYLSFVATR